MGRFVLSLGLLIGSGSTGRTGSVASFAIVVHQSNPNTNLLLADVRAFFSGATKQWPNGSKVVLVERDTGSATYLFLLEHILHMSSVEYKRHLLSIEFAGEAPVTLKVLNSEQAACKFVFNVPGAIALIETNSLNLAECAGIGTVRIDGRLPGQEGYRLR
jgi:ABC-type phosphate transport system substrate-binding protein